MASLSGFFPGLMPRNHDSVPHTMSGFKYDRAAFSSDFLSETLLQFKFNMRKLLFCCPSVLLLTCDVWILDVVDGIRNFGLLVTRGLKLGDNSGSEISESWIGV